MNIHHFKFKLSFIGIFNLNWLLLYYYYYYLLLLLFYYYALYFFTPSTFIGLGNSFPSIFTKINALHENVFLTKKGPSQLGAHFPWGFYCMGKIFFSTNSPSRNCRGKTFLSWDLIILSWYSWPWHKALSLFSSMRFNYSYLILIYSTPSNLAFFKTHIDGISTSIGNTTFVPYTNEYGVASLDVRITARYAHSVKGNFSCQSLQVSVIFLTILLMFLFAALLLCSFLDDRVLKYGS